MLLSNSPRGDHSADIESVHNYYENMVREEIQRQLTASVTNPGLFADIACVALNHLPPRYIRYDVDMAFYLSPKESQEMEEKVTAAVLAAIEFVSDRGGNRDL